MDEKKYLIDLLEHFSVKIQHKNPLQQHVTDKSVLKDVHMCSERSANEASNTPPLSPKRYALPRKGLGFRSVNRNPSVPRKLTDSHRKELQHEQQRSLITNNAPNEAGGDHMEFTNRDVVAKRRNNKYLDKEMEQLNSKHCEEAKYSKKAASKPMMGGYRDEIQMMAGYRDEPQMMAGYRDETQMMGGYRDETPLMAGYRDEPQMMAGYRDETQMMGGYRDETPLMAGYRDEPQMMAGYRDETQMMGDYRDETQMMAGYRDETQMMGGYRDETQMMGGYRDETQMMAGYRDEPQREQLQEQHLYKNKDFVGCGGGRDESAIHKMDIYQHKQNCLMRDHQASGNYRSASRDRQQYFKDYDNKNKDKDVSAVDTLPYCTLKERHLEEQRALRKHDNDRSVANRWSGTYVVQEDCTKDRHFHTNPQFDACDGRDVSAARRTHKMESGRDRRHSKYHASVAFYKKRVDVMKDPSGHYSQLAESKPMHSTSNKSNKSHQSYYISCKHEQDLDEIEKPHISDITIKCLDSNIDLQADQFTVGRDHLQLEEIESVAKSDKSYGSSHTSSKHGQEIDEIKTQRQVIDKTLEDCNKKYEGPLKSANKYSDCIGGNYAQATEPVTSPKHSSNKSYLSSVKSPEHAQDVNKIKMKRQVIDKTLEDCNKKYEGPPKSANKYLDCVGGNYAQATEPVTSPKHSSNKSYLSSVKSPEHDQDVNKIKIKRQLDKDDLYFKYPEFGAKGERMVKELPILGGPANNTLDNAAGEQSLSPKNSSSKSCLSTMTSSENEQDLDEIKMERQIDSILGKTLLEDNEKDDESEDDLYIRYTELDEFDAKGERMMEELPALDKPTDNVLDNAGESEEPALSARSEISCKDFDKTKMEYQVVDSNADEALLGAKKTAEQVAFDEKGENIMEDPTTLGNLESAGEQQSQVEESEPVTSSKHVEKEESMLEEPDTFGNNLDSSQYEESEPMSSASSNKNSKYVKDINKKQRQVQSTIEYIDSFIDKVKEDSCLNFTKTLFDDCDLKKNSRKSQVKARDVKNMPNKDILPDVAGSGLSVDEIFTYKVMTPLLHKMQRTFTRHRREELSILEDLERLPAIVKKLCNKENPKQS